MITFRVYEPHDDAGRVYTLWQQALGYKWPLAYETFQTVMVANPVYQAGDHLVALSGDEIVGFLATQIHQGTVPLQGNLLLLLVAPPFQRQGIGQMLHEQALKVLLLAGEQPFASSDPQTGITGSDGVPSCADVLVKHMEAQIAMNSYKSH